MESDIVDKIIIIALVLNVILFIKIWIMTNDVAKIKKSLQVAQDNSINLFFLKGEREKVRELLIDKFLTELLELKNSMTYYSEEPDRVETFNKRYSELKNKYMALFDKYKIEYLDFDSYKYENIP